MNIEKSPTKKQGERCRKIAHKSLICQGNGDIEMTKVLWIKAGKIAAKLRSKDKTIQLSDIPIGCCAKKHGYKILTFDRYFQEIPETDLTR